MFELADSGSSGDLPLLCPPLSSSSPFSHSLSLCLSLFHLSTCYATLCHAALAQVCGRVPVRTHTTSSGATPSSSSFRATYARQATSLPRPPPFLPSFLSSSLDGHRRLPPRASWPIAWAAGALPSLARSFSLPCSSRRLRGPTYTFGCTCAGAYCHAQWLDRAGTVHLPTHRYRRRRFLHFYLTRPTSRPTRRQPPYRLPFSTSVHRETIFGSCFVFYTIQAILFYTHRW